MAGRHRDQRQDHDGPDARVDAAGRRPARRRRGQRRHPAGATPCWRRHGSRYDVLAVELSSFQLHWATSPAPLASAVLNVAPDHVDWHGSLADYAADKGRVYERTKVACVYNVADPQTERLVRAADVQEGCRAVGFTLGVPSVGMVGIVDDLLVDRAFVEQRRDSAAELGVGLRRRPVRPAQRRERPGGGRAGPGVRRAAGRGPRRPARVPAGPAPHRARGRRSTASTYVDDSKATNPHAAAASLAAYDRVVWVAGGLAKGATFDDLVARAAPRLRGAVLLGPRPGRHRRPRWRDTRPRSPWSRSPAPTLGSWTRWCTLPRAWPPPATPCCSPRRAPRWTCSATTAHRGDAFAAAVRALATGSGR